MFNKVLITLILLTTTLGTVSANETETDNQTQAPAANTFNPMEWMNMMPMMSNQAGVSQMNLAQPQGWTVFMNPNNYAAFMNPATYGQFMNPQFYMQFADPNNMMAWMNPAAYSQFMNPNAYMQMMNPMAYMQFMNPNTYMQPMNPASYATFMDPNTYMQWMNPASYTASAQGSTTAYNWFDPNAWIQKPSQQAEQQ